VLREGAPAAIQRTQEFSTLCPSESAFMVKRLPVREVTCSYVGRTWFAIRLCSGIARRLRESRWLLYTGSHGRAPDEVFSWAAFDVAEFVPWILTSHCFPLASIRHG